VGSLLVSPPWIWLIFTFTLIVSVFLCLTYWVSANNLQKKLCDSLHLNSSVKSRNFKQISPLKLRYLFILLIGIFVFIFTQRWWGGLLMGIICGIGLRITQNIRQQKKRLKLVKQLPLLLQGLSNGLKAGYSLPQAFRFMEAELEQPLLYEVRKINRGLDLKKPIADTLILFSQRMKEENVRFFAESTIIQLRVGGNLVHLFSKVSHLIEDKLKLRQDLKTFTSQGKMSGILLALLWPISLLFFWLISPDHVSILFSSTAGNALLTVSLLLELIGFYFVWQIVRIKI
jgi:tight adherence protein B